MIARSSPSPGAGLISPVAFASAAVIVWNDLWLKRQHPGLLSGKLSDLGLCVFLPLFVAAAIEWGAATCRLRIDRHRVSIASCAVAGLYFSAIKLWPLATQAHVQWLSFVMPRWHFRAVTDPTDLVCLPAVAIAWWTMKERHGKSVSQQSQYQCRIKPQVHRQSVGKRRHSR